MADNTSAGSKKTKTTYKNAFEAVKSLGSSNRSVESGLSPKDFGLDREPKKSPQKEGSNLFSFQEHHENSIVKREIRELTEQIKREIDCIKRADKTLVSEIKDIEKLTVDALPEKPGIYHVRFLEVILSILKLVKAKINESSTWLQAMVSKKKKRGSLFAVRAKSKGTQYSMAEELKITRQTG